MALNANKSKHMLFGKHTNTHLPELQVKVNSSKTESSSEFNFLGLHLNAKLNWDAHINVVGPKISRVIGRIKKYSMFLVNKSFCQYI